MAADWSRGDPASFGPGAADLPAVPDADDAHDADDADPTAVIAAAVRKFDWQ